MNNGFTKGMIIGGLIGATVAMVRPEIMDQRSRRRMMKNGKGWLRKSGAILSDVIDVLK